MKRYCLFLFKECIYVRPFEFYYFSFLDEWNFTVTDIYWFKCNKSLMREFHKVKLSFILFYGPLFHIRKLMYILTLLAVGQVFWNPWSLILLGHTAVMFDGELNPQR